MNERYSRNEALFGADGQAKISSTKAAIVGLGGLGSLVAQQLAYLGVEDFAVIDFDVVTESSLNRLIGAVEGDDVARTRKIVVAERMIRSINPAAAVATIDGQLVDADSQTAIARADVVFGCLDRDIHRVELVELAAQHTKPYFDIATDAEGEGDDLSFGGRMVFGDGSQCLVCLPEVLNQQAMARDRLNPAQRDAFDRTYGIPKEALVGTGPSVVSVNGVVASLAVTEFMAWVTGVRPPVPQLIYRGERGIVRAATDRPSADCYYCTGIWGSAVNR